jgi:hypothetical protein
VQVLGLFGDTASPLPDCCSLYALVSDAEGPYLNRSPLSGSPFPTLTFRPAKLVTGQPVIPEDPDGSNPSSPPGQTAPYKGLSPVRSSGYPIRARVGSAEGSRQSDGEGSSY